MSENNLDFSSILLAREFTQREKIFTDRVSDVLKGFCFCDPLRPAAREGWTANGESLFRLFQDNWIGEAHRVRVEVEPLAVNDTERQAQLPRSGAQALGEG